MALRFIREAWYHGRVLQEHHNGRIFHHLVPTLSAYATPIYSNKVALIGWEALYCFGDAQLTDIDGVPSV